MAGALRLARLVVSGSAIPSRRKKSAESPAAALMVEREMSACRRKSAPRRCGVAVRFP
jgi:hypothetical protein